MTDSKKMTYLAGDWDGDEGLIQTIIQWNESDYWSLSFLDAHKLHQARDSSLFCSVKKSLTDRLGVSETFVLIVGEKTNTVTKGNCAYCPSYNSWTQSCARGYSVDYRSYIKFECEKAVIGKLRIVVIYNSPFVIKGKCPEVLRDKGLHIPAYNFNAHSGKFELAYSSIKDAIIGAQRNSTWRLCSK